MLETDGIKKLMYMHFLRADQGVKTSKCGCHFINYSKLSDHKPCPWPCKVDFSFALAPTLFEACHIQHRESCSPGQP